MSIEEQKILSAKKSVEYVETGMIVGIGSGTTSMHMIKALADKVKNENLEIIAVSSSKKSQKYAASLGIEIQDLDKVERIDLSIDGIDEVNPKFEAIKGGGGALLYEKILAANSDRYIWIADQTKLVDKLGKFPLATEVVPYGSEHLFTRLEALGYKPSFRMTDGEKYITDSGNYIIDLHLGEIENPRNLSTKLNNLAGVVENGLFYDAVDLLIVGTEEGAREFRN